MDFNEHLFEPSEGTIGTVHEAANEADAAGLCFIPPAQDGSKRPLPDPSGRWDRYKTARPTAEEQRQWYPGRTGIGIIIGSVSGHVECWDFDDRDTYVRLVATANHCGLGAVVDRIEHGYCDDTPGGGVRWLVRYPPGVERKPGSGIKLARRPKEEREKQHPGDNIKTLIELPAYAITAPTNGTVHPSGKPYVRRAGSFASIASYTVGERDALMDLARSFDAMPRRQAESKPAMGKQGGRPGDGYTNRTTWVEVLTAHGWMNVYTRDGITYWRRPGKDIGISATTNFAGADLLYVFSSSTPFEAEKSYTRFGAYAVLNHGGDFHAGARALAREGYGQKAAPNSDPTLHQVGDYRETELGIDWLRRTKDGDVWMPLTNFTARIVTDITLDDDVEMTKTFEVEAKLFGRVTRFTIPSHQFASLNWATEKLGARAIVQPGQMIARRAAVAIQMLSGEIPDNKVFAHTGWRRIDDDWVFLHAGGALGAGGPRVADVEYPSRANYRAITFRTSSRRR